MEMSAILISAVFLIGLASADPISIPYSKIDAPVVHWQNHHILHRGQTTVVLDEKKGLSILIVGESSPEKDLDDHFRGYLQNASLRVELEQEGKRVSF
jgi:hypothetical protein